MASNVLTERLADLQGKSIYQEISQCAADFRSLLNDEISHDLIVFCGPEKKPIYAHKVIIAARWFVSFHRTIFSYPFSSSLIISTYTIIVHFYSISFLDPMIFLFPITNLKSVMNFLPMYILEI